MPSKYDTNPLDPDFPERVKAEAEAAFATASLSDGAAETKGINAGAATSPPRPFAEEPTIRLYSAPADTSRPQALANISDDSAVRRVDPFGLPERWLTAVPYVPWYIGLVAGLVLLLALPRSEAKIRFHAAQGLAAHVAVFFVTMILGGIGKFTDIASIGNVIFLLVTSIMLIVFAIKAWRGNPVHIESVEDLTNWLEEKINPTMIGRKD